MSRRPLSEVHAAAREHEQRKRWSRGYPSNPMIDSSFKIKREAYAALRHFRSQHPFRAERHDWLRLIAELFDNLSVAYDMPTPKVSHQGSWEGDSGSSTYGEGGEHKIVLRGHESVLTALHEFAHARGYGETGAVWWSVNVFRRFFPRSFARLQNPRGSHVLRRADAEA